MPVCEKCHGTKRIAVEHDGYTDLEPCEPCIGPVNGCAKDHASILFHGTVCPLCLCQQQASELRREIGIVAATEEIARLVRDALEEKLRSMA